MSANYRFIPWVRSGMAATPGQGTGAVRRIPVALAVNGAAQDAMQVRIFGPGDVIGLDPRQVVRTEPAHLTADFEPNYFPAVELDRPDLPWLFSPAEADSGTPEPKGRLQPWLCLVCVRRQPGVSLTVDTQRPLPRLRIAGPVLPEQELPDLSRASAWVHAQIVEDESDPAPLADRLEADSPRNLARLVCPRRLDPRTAYIACLVPTDEIGRKAGLGLPITDDDENDLSPAWQAGQTEVELPVYYRFEFTTGETGDFESLVQRLEHRVLPGRVGVRRMSVGDLGFGLSGLEGAWLQGALRSPTAPVSPIPKSFENGLRLLLNRRADRQPGESPLLGPPIYGRWQAAAERVPNPPQQGAGDEYVPGWLEGLNLDPRNRASAGFGTLIVQDQQEELMTEAWRQLADTRRANQEINRAKLAVEVNLRLHAHLAAMSAEAVIETAGPAQTQLRPAETGARTLSADLRDDGLPAATASATLRRVARPLGPLSRRLRGPASPPPVKRLYRAPVAPPPEAAPGTLGLDVLEGSLRRLESVVAERSSSGTDAAGELLSAMSAQQEYLRTAAGLAEAPARAVLQDSEVQVRLEEHKSRLLTALDPEVTIGVRMSSRILPAVPDVLPGARAAGAETEPAPPPLELLAVPSPDFARPMYEALRDFSPELLFPGLEHVPPESVTLLETNPQFVESFMVGLNHEMGRELLWRGYPSDQRGTCFTRFWDSAGAQDDPMKLPPIHQWPLSQPLGGNFGVESEEDGGLVLLIRGELLRRYPGALIYAAPGISAQSVNDSPGTRRMPLFRGTLEPDISFLGFDLRLEEARKDPGWFFVIEQQPTEPRFGLDVPAQFGLDPTSEAQLPDWSELSWGHVAADAAQFAQMSHLPLAGPMEDQGIALPLAPPPEDQNGTAVDVHWGRNAAHMAAITLQSPARVAIHVNALLPE